ncbi:WecB/TagA/CpsF family glycosyltransferase [Roseivirga sp. E12]|uniref:WecB/TagA/CpsF family glycosyltransferase n=1 Tax=Roseivirga sp. E12 TaxID=2819237 RepID=UPI001ABCE377|nr:WecB/TagA/CpsF family glycosyltransferase [Roseivirga sp. E12]MBO3699731.1 WecB/TagA/CpsF family glycosyltransferase [Roseivirga sp. E12]
MPFSYTKHKLFIPEYANVNYDSASDIILEKAIERRSFGVSAMAVHGLMESIKNQELGKIINKIDLIVPDGQPVRWALNNFYRLGMQDRVYGPELTLHVLKKADQKFLNVYLYGSTQTTLEKFENFINTEFPNVRVCGIHVDRFREATHEEDLEDIRRINESDAHIVLVGRGCPRQEFWVANHKGKVNAAMMAVGAAFDFHAGTLKQAPSWMQRHGLEWLFRLYIEPRRLAKRYFVTNTRFILIFLKFKLFYRQPYRSN